MFVSLQDNSCVTSCVSNTVYIQNNELICITNATFIEVECKALRVSGGITYCERGFQSFCETSDLENKYIYPPTKECTPSCGDYYLEVNSTCQKQCRSGVFNFLTRKCLRGFEDCESRTFGETVDGWACVQENCLNQSGTIKFTYTLFLNSLTFCFATTCPSDWIARKNTCEMSSAQSSLLDSSGVFSKPCLSS